MKKYDLIIIGGGAAGITAAVYGKRAGLFCLIIERQVMGGQIAQSAVIENLPPFEKITGFYLAEKFSEMTNDIDRVIGEVTGIDEGFTVKTKNESYSSKAVIIANGAKRRKLGVKGEAEFLGKGVSYCAICDGNFFKHKTVCVIGGGNTAIEEALYLSEICRRVFVIHRRDKLRAQKYLSDKAAKKDNIEFLLSSEVSRIYGSDKVGGIIVNGQEMAVDGVFAAIGLEPCNKAFSEIVSLDEKGYIIAGEDCRTSHNGIFCAGDTRTKELRQIVTAMADGAAAATAAERYIHTM